MKQTIKLNEATLKKIVAESVKKVLKENNDKEKILFQKICELDRILNQTEYSDALGIEGTHLVGIYKSLHPLLQKAIRTLKPYTKVVSESHNNSDFDMSPEAVSYRNGNINGERQVINPVNLKDDIEQLIHYLMVSEGDSPRAQKAYQKAQEIKQNIFNKIDILSR